MFVVFDKKMPLATLAPAHDTRECIGVVRKYIKELEQKGNQSCVGSNSYIRQKIGARCMIILHKTKQGTSIIVKNGTGLNPCRKNLTVIVYITFLAV